MKTIYKVLLTILVIIVVAILGFITYIKLNPSVAVICYHNVATAEEKENYPDEADWIITVDNFEEQLKYLQKHNYKTLTTDEFYKWKNGEIKLPYKSVLITFDDGYTGVYTYAYQFAKEQNIPMTSFINNNTIGTEDVFYNWNQAKEMEESGLISIYSHGLTHARYNEETPQKLLEDTNKSYEELDEKLGNNRLKVFTYPYGLHTQEERVALWNNGYIQNLTDNRINLSNELDLSGIHRSYPLSDSVFKMLVKIQYRVFRYEILRNFLNYKINFNVHLLFF